MSQAKLMTRRTSKCHALPINRVDDPPSPRQRSLTPLEAGGKMDGFFFSVVADWKTVSDFYRPKIPPVPSGVCCQVPRLNGSRGPGSSLRLAERRMGVT